MGRCNRQTPNSLRQHSFPAGERLRADEDGGLARAVIALHGLRSG